jgi:hypothetical protein
VASAAELERLKKEAVDQALDWLRQNNRWGPKAEIVKITAESVCPHLSRVDGFQFAVGGGLLRSKRPTLVAARAGGPFVLELTPAQAQALQLGLGDRSHFLRNYRKGTDERRLRPRVGLSGLTLDQASGLPRGQRLTGTVAYRFTQPVSEDTQLRLTWYAGKLRSTGIFYPRAAMRAGQGVVRFDFPNIDRDEARREGLLAVFVEAATQQGERVVIESNTLAGLVVLRTGP